MIFIILMIDRLLIQSFTFWVLDKIRKCLFDPTETRLINKLIYQVLDGEIQKTGMVLPFTKDIWKPMLQRLRAEGIQDTEKSTFL